MTSPYPSFAALSMYIYIYSYICMVPIYVKSLQRYYIRSPCSLGCMGSNHQSSPTLGLPYYWNILESLYIGLLDNYIYIQRYVVIQYSIYVYIVAFSHNKVYWLYPLIYIYIYIYHIYVRPQYVLPDWIPWPGLVFMNTTTTIRRTAARHRGEIGSERATGSTSQLDPDWI